MEAVRYNVLPLDDDIGKKMNPDTAGRPRLIKGNRQLLFGGMGRLSENCVISVKNKSHAVTAEILVPKGGARGVIIAQGANIGGWALYAQEGKLKYCYNLGGVKQFYAEASTPIPEGAHQVRMEFAYAGGGLGKGGKVTHYYIDAATGVELKVVAEADMGTGPMTIETELSNYQPVDGILVPMTIKQNSPQGAVVITVDKVEFNPAIDDKIFRMPGK